MKKIFTKTILTVLTTATAVAPIVSCNGQKDRKVVIDSSVSSIVSESHKLTTEGHLAITLTVSDPTKEISSIESVTINGNSLVRDAEYYFIEGKLYITKNTLNKYKKGEIVVKPILGVAEQLLTLTCQSDIEKYRIGHKITKDNLIVKATYLKAGEKVISCGDDGYRIFKNGSDITDNFVLNGYTFTDQDKPTATFEIKFGGKTANVTFKYIYPLKSISVNTTATTLVFRAGETFTADKLIVDAEYEDESIIQGIKGWSTNYDGHKFTHDELGGQESITLPVTVTYTENDVTKTCTYDITLKHAKVTSLTITKPATTLEFYVGQYFNTDGLEVQANYLTVQVVKLQIELLTMMNLKLNHSQKET